MSATVPADGSGMPNPLAILTGDRMSERTKRLMAAYAVGALAWQFVGKVKKRFHIGQGFTVSVQGSDAIFDDVHAWLLKQIPARRQTSLMARSSMSSSRGDEPVSVNGPKRQKGRLLTSYDGDREQQLILDGHRITVNVSKNDANMQLSDRHSMEQYLRGREKIVFTTQTAAGRDAIVRFLQQITEVRALADRPPSFRIANKWGGWENRDDLPRRALDTVVLEADLREQFVGDVVEFLAREEAYGRLGVPWHRGYLLHGPPGTGKTSIARAVASHFGLDVYYLPLADLDADASLLQLVAAVSARSMLLLEDIDVAVSAALNREEHDTEASKISMSGLLNALDGVATPHGLITVMTTNRLDVLDDALVRPGRVDRRFEIGPLTPAQAAKLVSQFTGTAVTHDWPYDWPDHEITPADLVGILIQHCNDRAAAVEAVNNFLKEPRDESASGFPTTSLNEYGRSELMVPIIRGETEAVVAGGGVVRRRDPLAPPVEFGFGR